MALGLAEFDAEQRGYKEGVSDGIAQGEHQAKIETAKKFYRWEFRLNKFQQEQDFQLKL